MLQKEGGLYLGKGLFLEGAAVWGASDLEVLEDEDAEKFSDADLFWNNFNYSLVRIIVFPFEFFDFVGFFVYFVFVFFT